MFSEKYSHVANDVAYVLAAYFASGLLDSSGAFSCFILRVKRRVL